MKSWAVLAYIMILGLGIGCSKVESPTSNSVTRVDIESPAIQDIVFHSKEGAQKLDQSLLLEQSVTDWLTEINLEDNGVSYFLIQAKDQDTSLDHLSVMYAFYREDRVPPMKRWKKAEAASGYWKLPVTKYAIGRDATSFVGSRGFILEVKISDPSSNGITQKIKLNLVNQHPELNITIDPKNFPNPESYKSLKEMLSDATSTDVWQRLKNHVPLSQSVIFKKIWIENKSDDSFFIEVFGEGSIGAKQTKYYQRPVGDHLFAERLSEEIYGEAQVRFEVYELNENQNLVKAKPIPFEGFHAMYNLPGQKAKKAQGVLGMLLSDFAYAAKSFSLSHRVIDNEPNLFVTDLSYSGTLKILSAPTQMDPLFYAQELNWNDIAPKYIPHLALISD